MEQMEALKKRKKKKKRLDLLPEDSVRKRELIMMKHFLSWLDILPLDQSFLFL